MSYTVDKSKRASDEFQHELTDIDSASSSSANTHPPHHQNNILRTLSTGQRQGQPLCLDLPSRAGILIKTPTSLGSRLARAALGNKSSKKKFFVLEEGMLKYFEELDADTATPKHIFDLRGASVARGASKMITITMSSSVELNGGDASRELELEADSVREASQWRGALSRTCDLLADASVSVGMSAPLGPSLASGAYAAQPTVREAPTKVGDSIISDTLTLVALSTEPVDADVDADGAPGISNHHQPQAQPAIATGGPLFPSTPATIALAATANPFNSCVGRTPAVFSLSDVGHITGQLQLQLQLQRDLQITAVEGAAAVSVELLPPLRDVQLVLDACARAPNSILVGALFAPAPDIGPWFPFISSPLATSTAATADSDGGTDKYLLKPERVWCDLCPSDYAVSHTHQALRGK